MTYYVHVSLLRELQAWLGYTRGQGQGCMYKMPFFDDEMCTLQKVGGEDSKGRRVL